MGGSPFLIQNDRGSTRRRDLRQRETIMAFEFHGASKEQLDQLRETLQKQNSRIPLMIIVTRQGNDADFCVHTESPLPEEEFIVQLNLYIEIFRTMIAQIEAKKTTPIQ